jgi:uncharacterized RDD family membrane protein YckC
MKKHKQVIIAGAVILGIGILSIISTAVLGASGVSITPEYGTPSFALIYLFLGTLFFVLPAIGIVLLIIGTVMAIRSNKSPTLSQPDSDPGESPVVAGPQYAGFWKRVAALSVDGLLYFVGCMLFALVIILLMTLLPGQAIQPLQPGNAKVASLITAGWLTLIPFLIFILPLRVWHGQTAGKRLLKIQVVGNRDEVLSWGQCIGRPILYILSMIGFLGFLWCAWDREKRCWHDFLAHTHVMNL